jgi:hypothetical protein
MLDQEFAPALRALASRSGVTSAAAACATASMTALVSNRLHKERWMAW